MIDDIINFVSAVVLALAVTALFVTFVAILFDAMDTYEQMSFPMGAFAMYMGVAK
jgi:hypothetical protein